MAVGSIYLWYSFAGLYLAGRLTDIYVKDISCEDPIERSKVLTHMCILCLFYARRWCCAKHYLQCFGYSQKPNKDSIIYLFLLVSTFCTCVYLSIHFVFASKFAPEGIWVFAYTGNHFCFHYKLCCWCTHPCIAGESPGPETVVQLSVLALAQYILQWQPFQAVVSNFSKFSQAGKEALKHWACMCT